MKILFPCVSALLLLAATASAQQGQPGTRAPMHPVADRIQPWDCELPAVPGVPHQTIAVVPGQLVEWCVVNTGVDPVRAAPWTATVDGGVASMLAHACRAPAAITESVLCYAVLPLAATTQLALMGVHTLAIASIAIAEGVPLTLQVERPSCLLDGMTYDVHAPLPPPPVVNGAAVPNGNLQSTLGAFTIESRIGRLRQDGWHIEWDRAQFAVAPVAGGIWAVLGWCDGRE